MQRFLRQLVDSSRFLELDTIFIRRIGSHLEESYSEGYDVGGGGWCGVWSPGCDGVFGAVKFAKVMFLHLCHSVQGGVCLSACWDSRPPRSRHHPQEQNPHPTPWEQTPPCAVHAGGYCQPAGGTHPTGMHTCYNYFHKRVKNFVHGGWQGGMHGRGTCMAGGMHGRRGMRGRGGHVWQEK